MTLVREKNTTYSFILLLNNVCLDFIYFCEMWFSSVLRYSLPPLCVRLVGFLLISSNDIANLRTTTRPQASAMVRTALPSGACTQSLTDYGQTTGSCDRTRSTTICCMQAYRGQSINGMSAQGTSTRSQYGSTQIHRDSVVTTTPINHYDDDLNYPFHRQSSIKRSLFGSNSLT